MKDTFKINTFILEGLPPWWSSAWLLPLFPSGATSSSGGIFLGRLAIDVGIESRVYER